MKLGRWGSSERIDLIHRHQRLRAKAHQGSKLVGNEPDTLLTDHEQCASMRTDPKVNLFPIASRVHGLISLCRRPHIDPGATPSFFHLLIMKVNTIRWVQSETTGGRDGHHTRAKEWLKRPLCVEWW